MPMSNNVEHAYMFLFTTYNISIDEMQNFCSFWLAKDFLHMMLEASSTKEQIDKLDFTK